jgi:HEAT repeat protein
MKLLAYALIAALGDEKEADQAIQAFKAAMKSPEVVVRASAVAELGRCGHEKVIRVLGSCLVTDDKVVRVAAARALGRFNVKKLQICALLSDALGANLKEPEVRAAALIALKDLREQAALGPAYRYLDDRDARVAEAAIDITGTVRAVSSIEPLIRLMKRLAVSGDGYSSGDGSFEVPPDEQLRRRARQLQTAAGKALRSITGENWASLEEWEVWWKRNSATFRVKH